MNKKKNVSYKMRCKNTLSDFEVRRDNYFLVFINKEEIISVKEKESENIKMKIS